MEFSIDSIARLRNLLQSKIVSDEKYDELLSTFSEVLLIEKSQEKRTSISNDPTNFSDKIRDGITNGNIFGLLVEAARHKFTTEQLKNFLEAQQLSDGPRVEKLLNAYEDQREQLIAQLEDIGNQSPCIVDVNWRLDYCIKRNTNSDEDSCIYYIDLITKKYGTINHTKFTCNRHQLQELVYKLKDIVRHLEKLSRA